MYENGVESPMESLMPENTQEIFGLLTELWNTGNTKLVAQLYDDQATRTDPNLAEPARGAQQIANFVAEVRKGFPDFKVEIKQRIGQEDQIVSEWTCTGTHDGDYQGIPPTHKRVQISGVTVTRIARGKITEERVYFDRLELLQQLGVAPGAVQGGAKSAGQH